MSKSRKYILISLILLAVLVFDQVTKKIAQVSLADSPTISLAGGLVRLHYSENSGAILGLGGSLSPEVRFWAFTVLAGLLLIGTLWLLWRLEGMTALSIIGSALLLGGGLSNLLDRLLNDGAVVDFMSLGIGPFRTGIFNLADVAIMAGAGMLLIWSLRFRQPAEDLDEGDSPDPDSTK